MHAKWRAFLRLSMKFAGSTDADCDVPTFAQKSKMRAVLIQRLHSFQKSSFDTVEHHDYAAQECKMHIGASVVVMYKYLPHANSSKTKQNSDRSDA